jgi:hypothetical protein
MMKSKVLDRPLFKGDKSGMSEEEASNVGIMDGFMESMMSGEMDDSEPEDEEYKSEKIIGRSPDSPEILMNNLRGDMRSVDARVEELADMVGMRAAQETPQEVLALLQPVLAGQSAPPAMPPGGIGGLPPSMPPAGGAPEMPPPMPMEGGAPPMDMEGGPPPPMPPEAAGGIGSLPMDQEAPPPVGMAKGGYVQHFQQGSDEEGVTPVADNATYAYSPEMIQQAQAEIAKLLAEKPVAPPSLDRAMASRIPQYKAVLGGSKDLTQAQMLFDIAGGFLNVAAGTDAEGRPIRGAPSSAMRLAAGLKNVPAMVGARAAEYQKADRDVKMMAMQAGEKDIATAREYNYKLIDGQRKIWTEIIKADAKAKGVTAKGMFGSGLKAQAWDFLTKNAPGYAAGILTPDQDRAFNTSFAVVNEPQYYQDEVTGKWLSRRPDIPSFITDAFNQRSKIPVPSKGKVSTTEVPPVSVSPPPASSKATPAVSTTSAVPTPSIETSPTTDKAPAVTPMAANVRKSPTLWQLTGVLTGPIPTIKDVVSSVPGFGNVGREVTQARSRFMGDFRELVKALQNSPVYAQGERKSIESELDIEPRFFDDPAKLRNKLIGIDDYLLGRYNDSKTNATNSNLPAKDRQEYLRIGKLIENFRPKLGVPVRVYSIEEVNNLPPNTPFLWNGTDFRVRN